MRETTSFYMTLPSNASMDVYPDNTGSEYRIQLPRKFYLQHQYEVALAEIQYPHTWPTFPDKYSYRVLYTLESGYDLKQISIPEGHYKSIHELNERLNSAFEEEFNKEEYSGIDCSVRFSCHDLTRHSKIVIKNVHDIHLSRGLADVMGFKRLQITNDTDDKTYFKESDYPTDITRGFNTLYVYCNLCEPNVVGNYTVPLLRAVAVQGRDGKVETTVYNMPHYVPVSTNKFSTVEISIKNDVGENITFKTGKVYVKLHFRPRAI